MYDEREPFEGRQGMLPPSQRRTSPITLPSWPSTPPEEPPWHEERRVAMLEALERAEWEREAF